MPIASPREQRRGKQEIGRLFGSALGLAVARIFRIEPRDHEGRTFKALSASARKIDLNVSFRVIPRSRFWGLLQRNTLGARTIGR